MDESIDAATLAPAFGEENGKDPLGVLEQRVEALLDRHREALARIADLQSQLSERGREVEQLAGELAGLRRLRSEVLDRVDGIIERVDELEQLSTQGGAVDSRQDEFGSGA